MFATNDYFFTSKLDPATGLILICQTGIRNVYTIDINDINNNNRNTRTTFLDVNTEIGKHCLDNVNNGHCYS